jgi:hypothetical protein
MPNPALGAWLRMRAQLNDLLLKVNSLRMPAVPERGRTKPLVTFPLGRRIMHQKMPEKLVHYLPLILHILVIHSSSLYFHSSPYRAWSRDTGQLWFDSRQGRQIFLFSIASTPEPTQPPIQGEPGTLSPRLKRPGREGNHSPSSSAEVKKVGVIPHCPICLHGVVFN